MQIKRMLQWSTWPIIKAHLKTSCILKLKRIWKVLSIKTLNLINAWLLLSHQRKSRSLAIHISMKLMEMRKARWKKPLFLQVVLIQLMKKSFSRLNSSSADIKSKTRKMAMPEKFLRNAKTTRLFSLYELHIAESTGIQFCTKMSEQLEETPNRWKNTMSQPD